MNAYDNLTKERNKGITDISYNVLSLPQVVTFSNGSTITYLYTADGRKLRTVHVINSTTTTTDYCGNVIYENGIQKLLLTEEGYVDLSASTPAYYYYLKDHQGNNRVVINSSGTVMETNHYYPFGGVFSTSSSVQPYKYNGKELDSKNGLNWYDYGARHYDPAIGQFTTMDPLTEKYYSTSFYAYCLNNPVRYIDPKGQDIWDIIAGYGIGLATNVIPGTGFLRDYYAPNDYSDYNNALRGADNASMVAGLAMFVDGGNRTAAGGGIATAGLVVSAASGGTATVVGGPVAAGGAIVIGAGAIETGAGTLLMSNAKQNQEQGYERGKQNNNEDITFTQGNGEKAKKITTSIPEGFKKIKERTRNDMPIFKKGNEYISPDRDGHNGGIWKKANSIDDLNNKKTRMGTYDENLNRIGN